MARTSCKLCKHLEGITSHGCRQTVEYRCLKKCLPGQISEMRTIANEMRGMCPCFENKYQVSNTSQITSYNNLKIESKSTNTPIESYLL